MGSDQDSLLWVCAVAIVACRLFPSRLTNGGAIIMCGVWAIRMLWRIVEYSGGIR